MQISPHTYAMGNAGLGVGGISEYRRLFYVLAATFSEFLDPGTLLFRILHFDFRVFFCFRRRRQVACSRISWLISDVMLRIDWWSLSLISLVVWFIYICCVCIVTWGFSRIIFAFCMNKKYKSFLILQIVCSARTCVCLYSCGFPSRISNINWGHAKDDVS